MNKSILSLALFATFATSAAMAKDMDVANPTVSITKGGADDPVGDDHGRHGGGHKLLVAKHGTDDPIGDDRGRHIGGGHRGGGHKIHIESDGRDDPIGDDHGRHGGGHKVVLG